MLVTDGSQSFVIFLYADGLIQWTTGDSSNGVNGTGGIPAQVGFNAGDGINFAAVPESRTADIIDIDTTSNIGVPGVWAFQVNEEAIVVSSGKNYMKIKLAIHAHTHMHTHIHTHTHARTHIHQLALMALQ